MILILLIICCSLIGTVVLIGLCTPISVVYTTPPKDEKPSTVIEEPFQDDSHSNDNQYNNVYRKSIIEDNKKTDLKKWIATSSIQILRSKGMTDEEIKYELMRDFSLTEKQVDEILLAQ